MKRKTRIITAFVLLILLIGLPAFWIVREVQQHRKDQALIAAIKANHNAQILALLAEGASGEARDTGTPASFHEVLNPLLDRISHMGVSSPERNNKHLSALLLLYQQASNTMPYAGPGPDTAVIRALLDHGAKVNDRESTGRSPLCYASLFSNDDTVRLLLARGADPEAKNEFEDTPLFMADAGTTEVLLEYGANVESRNIEAMTPLLWAAKLGRSNVVPILLAHGANLEAKDKHAQTPLILAVRNWRFDVIRILLERGAYVSQIDLTGRTALDYVKADPAPKASSIAALLRKYGAK